MRRALHISEETGENDGRSAKRRRRLALSHQDAILRHRVRGESVGVFASNIVIIILRIRGRRRNVDLVPKRKSDGVIEALHRRRSRRRVSRLRKLSRNRRESCVDTKYKFRVYRKEIQTALRNARFRGTRVCQSSVSVRTESIPVRRGESVANVRQERNEILVARVFAIERGD